MKDMANHGASAEGHPLDQSASAGRIEDDSSSELSVASAMANLGRFVDSAKASPALRGIDWAATEWRFSDDDPVAQKIRRHRSYQPTLLFTTRESSMRGLQRVPVAQRVPMPPEFAPFAKAYVRTYAEYGRVSLGPLRRALAVTGRVKTSHCGAGQNQPP